MESKRILLTGAHGVVGSIINKLLGTDHEIITTGRSADLDLTDAGAVNEFFKSQNKFDVLIHCAARGTEDTNSADPSIVWTNLTMYENLKNNYRHFHRLLNIASGCELQPGAERKESTLREYLPKEPYGLSKNLIARDVLKHRDWYNLRLFGIATFTRVFKKVFEAAERGEKTFDLTDRYMDYLYEYQLEYITRLYVETNTNLIKDINMVPFEKHRVSDYVNGYISRMKLDIKLNIVGFNDEPYTGDANNSKRLNVI